MNILYIHGLNSSLSEDKQLVLERYAKIEAPAIDYENNPDSIVWLYNHFRDAQIDVIIGSSMGGFAGFHLSKLFKVPALIFNPALAERSVFQIIPDTPKTNGSSISIIIGAKDDIVDPKSTLNFLGDLLIQPQHYNIQIRPGLEHRIPIDVFDEEINRFIEGMKL